MEKQLKEFIEEIVEERLKEFGGEMMNRFSDVIKLHVDANKIMTRKHIKDEFGCSDRTITRKIQAGKLIVLTKSGKGGQDRFERHNVIKAFDGGDKHTPKGLPEK
jgi:predicted HTH transcriptional regulator